MCGHVVVFLVRVQINHSKFSVIIFCLVIHHCPIKIWGLGALGRCDDSGTFFILFFEFSRLRRSVR